MIPLLNKLPKTPDSPPIRYNIKTEYITEEDLQAVLEIIQVEMEY